MIFINEGKYQIKDIIVLFLVNIIFFYKIIFVDHFAYSHSELLSNFFPLYQYIGFTLRSGQLPLWDPYYYFSFVGVSFPGVFYPPNIVVSFVGSFLNMDSAFIVMQLSEVMHYFLASTSMYLLLRGLYVRREGSLIGAISFAYSGFLAKSIQQTVIINTVSWFPLIFLFFIKGIQGNKKAAIFSGLFLSMAILAGYMAITFYMVGVMLFYFLWTVYASVKEKQTASLKNTVRNLLKKNFFPAFITLAVAIGIGGIQLLPTLEYAYQSIRYAATYDALTLWGSIPAAHLVTLVIPHFFGGAHEPHWGGVLVKPLGFWEVVYYSSLVTLTFAFFSLITKKRNDLQRHVHSFAIFLFLLSIFMMMGKNSAVFGLYYALKVLPTSRIPARWGFFLVFSVAVVGSIGFSSFIDTVMKKKYKIMVEIVSYLRGKIKFIITLGVIGALVFILAKEPSGVRNILHFILIAVLSILLIVKAIIPISRKTSWWIYFLIFLVFIDVFIASSRINPVAPDVQPPRRPTESFVDNKIIKFLEKDRAIYRVSGLGWPLMQGQTTKTFTLGYLGGFSYRRFAEFRGETNPMGSGAHSWFDLRKDPTSQRIDFYNIKYLFSHQKLDKISSKYVPVPDIPNLYLNRDVMPRAFIVGDYEVIKDDNEILKRMVEIDLSEKVILEETPSQNYKISPTNIREAKIVRYTPLEIDIETNIDSDAILVMSDIFYPGWKVYIDNIERKMLRANYVFRAVELPKGKHNVTYRFKSNYFRTSIILLCITVFIVLIYCLKVKVDEARA